MICRQKKVIFLAVCVVATIIVVVLNLRSKSNSVDRLVALTDADYTPPDNVVTKTYINRRNPTQIENTIAAEQQEKQPVKKGWYGAYISVDGITQFTEEIDVYKSFVLSPFAIGGMCIPDNVDNYQSAIKWSAAGDSDNDVWAQWYANGHCPFVTLFEHQPQVQDDLDYNFTTVGARYMVVNVLNKVSTTSEIGKLENLYETGVTSMYIPAFHTVSFIGNSSRVGVLNTTSIPRMVFSDSTNKYGRGFFDNDIKTVNVTVNKLDFLKAYENTESTVDLFSKYDSVSILQPASLFDKSVLARSVPLCKKACLEQEGCLGFDMDRAKDVCYMATAQNIIQRKPFASRDSYILDVQNASAARQQKIVAFDSFSNLVKRQLDVQLNLMKNNTSSSCMYENAQQLSAKPPLPGFHMVTPIPASGSWKQYRSTIMSLCYTGQCPYVICFSEQFWFGDFKIFKFQGKNIGDENDLTSWNNKIKSFYIPPRALSHVKLSVFTGTNFTGTYNIDITNTYAQLPAPYTEVPSPLCVNLQDMWQGEYKQKRDIFQQSRKLVSADTARNRLYQTYYNQPIDTWTSSFASIIVYYDHGLPRGRFFKKIQSVKIAKMS